MLEMHKCSFEKRKENLHCEYVDLYSANTDIQMHALRIHRFILCKYRYSKSYIVNT